MILGLADHRRRHDPGPRVRRPGWPAAAAPIVITPPPVDQRKAFSLARSDDGNEEADLTLGLSVVGAETKLFAELTSTLEHEAVGWRSVRTAILGRCGLSRTVQRALAGAIARDDSAA